jgi:hypothetical protein
MKYIPNDWTIKQDSLKKLLSKEETFDNGIKLLLDMHSILHDKKVYKSSEDTIYNKLWVNLKDETCKIITKKETSILWDIWHITRIEDIIANIVIGNSEEVLNDEMQKKLNIKTKDTGNAMNKEEIELLNKNINIKELNEYRIKVGKQTVKIIKGLKYSDMKRKVEKKQLDKIMKNGGLLEDEKSKWLLDFWWNKNVLGLLMIPITRHQTMHLNDCVSIKEKGISNLSF